MTVADAIVASLIANKCSHVFGIPGVQIYELMDAFYKRSDQVKFISTRHEQGAAYMANGYAHIINDFGVAVVVPGPGLMNASAGIGTAYASSNSVLVARQLPIPANRLIGLIRTHVNSIYARKCIHLRYVNGYICVL